MYPRQPSAHLSPEHEEFRAVVRSFVEREIRPHATEWEAAGEVPRALYTKAAEAGLLGLRYEPRWGGSGQDFLATVVLCEELARGDSIGAAVALMAQSEFALSALADEASDELKEAWLAPAIRGELIGGIGVSEPGAGSDVAAITTRAVRDGDEWRIFGDKHFCSNVDAEVFIVLARPEGAPHGVRGLATFIVPRLDDDGSPNGFRIKRLKPKLGTVGVPTAEVELEGARAWLAGTYGTGGSTVEQPDAQDGRGIHRMMEMVNGSRFGVAVMGLGIHRRSFLEAAIYAASREQWGQRIDSYPMVRETLVDVLVELEAGMAMTFECAAANRTTLDEEEGRLLRRILIPIAKVRATRAALLAASAGLEMFGGNGYMEDWPMARQFRDAQCHTIWEGTENVCSLDVRRAMRSEGAHEALLARMDRAVDAARAHEVLARPAEAVAATAADARRAVDHYLAADTDVQLLQARRLTYLLSDLAEGALLLDEAVWALEHDGDARKALVARRYARNHLETPAARGLLDADLTVVEHFEPLIRYGRLEVADVA